MAAQAIPDFDDWVASRSNAAAPPPTGPAAPAAASAIPDFDDWVKSRGEGNAVVPPALGPAAQDLIAKADAANLPYKLGSEYQGPGPLLGGYHGGKLVPPPAPAAEAPPPASTAQGPQIITPEQYAAAHPAPTGPLMMPTQRTPLPKSFTTEPSDREIAAQAGQEVTNKIVDAAPFLVGPYRSVFAEAPGLAAQGAGELAIPAKELARRALRPRSPEELQAQALEQTQGGPTPRRLSEESTRAGAAGLSHLAEAGMNVGMLAATYGALAAPLKTAAYVIGASAAQKATEESMKAAGAAPEYSKLGGQIAGAAALIAVGQAGRAYDAVFDAIDAHNAAANEIFQQERARGQAAAQSTQTAKDILGASAVPVTIDGQIYTISPVEHFGVIAPEPTNPQLSRPGYRVDEAVQVQNDEGKIVDTTHSVLAAHDRTVKQPDDSMVPETAEAQVLRFLGLEGDTPPEGPVSANGKQYIVTKVEHPLPPETKGIPRQVPTYVVHDAAGNTVIAGKAETIKQYLAERKAIPGVQPPPEALPDLVQRERERPDFATSVPEPPTDPAAEMQRAVQQFKTGVRTNYRPISLAPRPFSVPAEAEVTAALERARANAAAFEPARAGKVPEEPTPEEQTQIAAVRAAHPEMSDADFAEAVNRAWEAAQPRPGAYEPEARGGPEEPPSLQPSSEPVAGTTLSISYLYDDRNLGEPVYSVTDTANGQTLHTGPVSSVMEYVEEHAKVPNESEYVKALTTWTKASTAAALQYQTEHPGISHDDALRAVQGQVGRKPLLQDYQVPAEAKIPKAPKPEKPEPPPEPSDTEVISADTPNAPTASQPTKPESPATLAIQMQQLAEGRRRVVMIPGAVGEPAEGTYPDTIAKIGDKFGNTYFYRKDLIEKSAIPHAAKRNKLPEILGHATLGMGAPDKSVLDQSPGLPQFSVVVHDANGVEVQSILTNEEHLSRTIAAANALTPPGGSVTKMPTEEALAGRQGAPPAPAPGPMGEPEPVVPAATAPTHAGYETARGSQYAPAGRGTTRHKVATGEKFSPSDETVYLAPDVAHRVMEELQANNVGNQKASVRRVSPHEVAVVVKDRATGAVRNDLSKVIPTSNAPAVGLHPLELWHKDPETGEYGFHLGHAITKMHAHPEVLHGVWKALHNATRSVVIGGERQSHPDPVAVDVLRALSKTPNGLREFDNLIGQLTDHEPTFIGAGFGHVVLDLGNGQVLKLGAIQRSQPNQFSLPPMHDGAIGDVSWAVYPKLDTHGITPQDVASVELALGKDGLEWRDAGVDNLGRGGDGSLYIIDGAVTRAAGEPEAEPIGEPAPVGGGGAKQPYEMTLREFTKSPNATTVPKGHILASNPKDFTAENLEPYKAWELRAVALAYAAPTSGTKAQVIATILRVRDLRERLAGATLESLQELPGKELKALTKQARIYQGGNKRAMAAGLLNWRNEARRKGVANLAEVKWIGSLKGAVARGVELSPEVRADAEDKAPWLFADETANVPPAPGEEQGRAEMQHPLTYFTGSSGPGVEARAMERGDIGLMITPLKPDYLSKADKYPVIAIDNGAFSKTTPFSVLRFVELLNKIEQKPEIARKVQFVVAPDVPMNAAATLAMFPEWAERISDRGLPVALAAQDGLENMLEQIPWDDFETLFMGGSTDWKIGKFPDTSEGRSQHIKWINLLKAAEEHGKALHVGRVNSFERSMLANYGMGAMSVDGTHLAHGPDEGLARIESWLNTLNQRGPEHGPRFAPKEPADEADVTGFEPLTFKQHSPAFWVSSNDRFRIFDYSKEGEPSFKLLDNELDEDSTHPSYKAAVAAAKALNEQPEAAAPAEAVATTQVTFEQDGETPPFWLSADDRFSITQFADNVFKLADRLGGKIYFEDSYEKAVAQAQKISDTPAETPTEKGPRKKSDYQKRQEEKWLDAYKNGPAIPEEAWNKVIAWITQPGYTGKTVSDIYTSSAAGLKWDDHAVSDAIFGRLLDEGLVVPDEDRSTGYVIAAKPTPEAQAAHDKEQLEKIPKAIEAQTRLIAMVDRRIREEMARPLAQRDSKASKARLLKWTRQAANYRRHLGQMRSALKALNQEAPELTKDHWRLSLPLKQRKAVLKEMRKIRAEADAADEEHRKLSPKYGEIAVGGAHMEPFFRSQALTGFLRALGDGKTPAEAVVAGNEDANFAIKKWNESRRRDYVVHRALNAERPHLEDLARRLNKTAETGKAAEAEPSGLGFKSVDAWGWQSSDKRFRIQEDLKKPGSYILTDSHRAETEPDFDPRYVASVGAFNSFAEAEAEAARIAKATAPAAAPPATGAGVRLVTGSVDAALAKEGIEQAKDLGERAKGVDEIRTAPNKRSMQTGQFVAVLADIEVKPANWAADWLDPWKLGEHEGKPLATENAAINDRIVNKPDESPGTSPYSGEEGESFNEARDRIISGVQAQQREMATGMNGAYAAAEHVSVINITSGRVLKIIAAWGKAGQPADRSVDLAAMTAEGEFSKPGQLFKLEKDGLKPVDAVRGGGQYFAQHGASEWNTSKPSAPAPKGEADIILAGRTKRMKDLLAQANRVRENQANDPHTIKVVADMIRKEMPGVAELLTKLQGKVSAEAMADLESQQTQAHEFLDWAEEAAPQQPNKARKQQLEKQFPQGATINWAEGTGRAKKTKTGTVNYIDEQTSFAGTSTFMISVTSAGGRRLLVDPAIAKLAAPVPKPLNIPVGTRVEVNLHSGRSGNFGRVVAHGDGVYRVSMEEGGHFRDAKPEDVQVAPPKAAAPEEKPQIAVGDRVGYVEFGKNHVGTVIEVLPDGDVKVEELTFNGNKHVRTVKASIVHVMQPATAPSGPKSWKYELEVAGEGWKPLGVSYATKEEADQAGREHFNRWFGAKDVRTVESDEAPNSVFEDGRSRGMTDEEKAQAGKKAETEETIPPVNPETQEETQADAHPPAIEDAPADQSGHIKLANAVLRKLQAGEGIGNNPALEKLAAVAYGGTRASGAYVLKEAHDAVEAAVNRYIADSIGQNILLGDFKHGLIELRALLEGLPTQNVRTDAQIELQQFSTPPTLSFLAATAAAILPSDIAGEPSAGTGSLAAWAKAAGAIVHTNEIDKRRVELLNWALRGNPPTSVDAEILNATWPQNIQPTVIIMNPPFSSTGGRVGHHSNEFGYRHVMNALIRLQQGGRLVAILGEGARLNAPSARQFWRDVAKRGGLVRANIGISGKEYVKYGTTFGNRLIIIDKANAVDFSEQLGRPASLIPITGEFDTIEEAYDAIEPIIGERRVVARPAPGSTDVGEPSDELPEPSGAGPGLPGGPGGAIQSPQPGETGPGLPGRGPEGGTTAPAGGQPGIKTGDTTETAAEGTGGGANAGVGAPGILGINPDDLVNDIIKALEAEGQKRPEAPVSAPGPTAPAPAPAPAPPRTPRPPRTPAPAPAPAPAPPVKKTPLDAAADQALKELNDMLGLGGDILARPRDTEAPIPINPEIIKRLGLVGARAILAGATSFHEWSLKMVEQAGPVLTVVATKSRMSPSSLLREIHLAAARAAKAFGVTAEETPPDTGDESIVQPPRDEDLVTLEARKEEDMLARVEDDSSFVQFVPAIQGLAHPGIVVETKVMASISGPPITYTPNLPAKEIANAPKPLSAVQMEAVARAGQSHETFNGAGARHAFLLGDGTGLGKGQEIAAIIWDNNRQGRKRAIWLSGSADLIEQAAGDFTGLGATELSKQLHSINDWKNGKEIDLKEGVLFSTYSTLQQAASSTNGISRLQQIMNWLGPDGVIIFDEAQRGKNAVPGDMQTEGSKAGKAVVEIQKQMPQARVVYVSATAATEVRNVGYMTRLGMWGPGGWFYAGFQQFMAEVGSGGIAAMELIARELKAAGRYMSRSISYKGVTFEEETHKLTDDQIKIYDEAAQAWQDVLNAALDQVDDNGGNAAHKRAIQNGVWGEHQRFFRALLTAMKTPTLFDRIDKALADKDPRAIIVSLIGTGEAQQKRQMAQLKAKGDDADDDELDFSPREILVNIIKRVYPIHMMEEYTDPETGETETRFVLDENGKKVENPEAVAKRDALIKHLEETLALPESPLDQIINTYGRDQVAEITGRKEVVWRNPETGRMETISRAPAGVKQDDINKYEMGQFQDGKKNILVMSRSGGTGFSFHAALDRANQRKRLQIALELSWSADDQVQAFGRSHRSNQRVAPEFVILSTDAGGEKRFSSSIARRLESLGALTKGQRDASGGSSVLAKYNFETQQGIVAATAFYTYLLQDPEIPGSEWNGLDILRKMGVLDEHIDEHTGEPQGDPTISASSMQATSIVKRLLNRILNVQMRAQNGIYDLFIGFFDDAVQAAIEAGTLDTGVNLVRGDKIDLKESRPIATDPETKAKTYRYILEVTRKNKPVPVEFVKDLNVRGRGHMMRRRENRGPDAAPDQLLWVERSNQPITTRGGGVERAYKVFGPGHRENARDYRRMSESDLNLNYEPMTGARNAERLAQLDTDIKKLEDDQKKYKDEQAQALASGAPPRPQYFQGYSDPGGVRREKYYDDQTARAKTERKQILDAMHKARETQWDEWQKAFDAAPAGRVDRIDMIGGAVMRIWSHLHVGRARLDIRIAYPDQGGSITGVVMTEGNASAVEHALTGNNAARTTDSIFRAALSGAERFTLAGGMRLQQGRAGRGNVVEIITTGDPYAQRFLTNNGVKKETIYGRAKYYIPSDIAAGVRILDVVLAQFPIMAAGTDGNNVLGRPREKNTPTGPIWFSQLEKTVESKMPAKASPAQVIAIVSNPQSGVKADELKWTDLKAWLATQKAMVTKAQVLDYLRMNGVRLTESLHGGPKGKLWEVFDPKNGVPVASFDNWADAASDAARRGANFDYAETGKGHAISQETKHKTLVLPGGNKEYGELLMLLPPKEVFDPNYAEYAKAQGYTHDQIQKTVYTDDPVFMNWARNREGVAAAMAASKFKTEHWEESNPIAHIRFNTRTSPDGKRVFHLEEIQSDWHQQGRDEGYRPTGEEKARLDREKAEGSQERENAAMRVNVKTHARRVAMEKMSSYAREIANHLPAEDWLGFGHAPARALEAIRDFDNWAEMFKVKDPTVLHIGPAYRQAALDVRKLDREISEAQDQHKAAMERVWKVNDLLKGVPDAPFSKTWHELAFRRALRWAAENGYDRITWTTGDQQAARYDLSKHVTRVEWHPFGEKGHGELLAFRDDSTEPAIEHKIASGDLAKFIGKDAARKLLDSETLTNQYKLPYQSIEATDLKVGGHGMNEFYDEIMPRYAAKLGKQWGATVTTSQINTRRTPVNRWEGPAFTQADFEAAEDRAFPNGSGVSYSRFLDADMKGMDTAARNARDNKVDQIAKELGGTVMRGTEHKSLTVHSMDITPAMVESVLSGQALFRPRDLKSYKSPTDYAATDARFEKGVEGNGHVYVNRPGARMLADIFNMSESWGFAVPERNYNYMIGKLEAIEAARSVDPVKAAAASTLLKAIRAAHDDDPIVTIVDGGPGTPRAEILKTEREEAFHRGQMKLGLAGGEGAETYAEMMKWPDLAAAVAKIHKARPAGYTDEVALIELGAMLGTDQGSEIKLARPAAAHLFMQYMDALIAIHGPEAGKLLRLTAPLIRKALGEKYVKARWNGDLNVRSLARSGLQRGEEPPARAGTAAEQLPGETGKANERAVEGKRSLARPKADLISFLSGKPPASTAAPAEDKGKHHYTFGSMTERLTLPGRNLAEVRAANVNVYNAAVRAGAAMATAGAIMHNALPLIKEALKDTGMDTQKLFSAYQESRLQAIQQRYMDWSEAVLDMDDAQIKDAVMQTFVDGRSTLLETINLLDHHYADMDLKQTALAAAERGDWAGLRALAGEVFFDASEDVQHTMPPDEFNRIHDIIRDNPNAREADHLYGELIEKEIAEAHAMHEGIFAEDLGPLDRYFPLMWDKAKANRMTAGARKPYRSPVNINNRMAKGMAKSGYVTDLPTFTKHLATSIRASGKANLLKVISDEGWSAPEPANWDFKFEGPDGIVYQGVREEKSAGRTIISNGNVIHTAASNIIMPAFLNEGLKLILAKEPANPNDIVKGLRFLNTIATKGPWEVMFHSTALLGTLYGNTPFLAGNTKLQKITSAPLLKYFQIRAGLISMNPETPENAAKLIRIAKVGALPARANSVTYSKDVAETIGAEKVSRWNFAPWLYGPQGLDAKARLMLYDMAMAHDPDMSDEDLGDFINQIGNYTPEFQGVVERALKYTGVGPFATAGMTRIVNAFHAITGTGPAPKKGKAKVTNLMRWLMEGLLGALAFYIFTYKALTGKWPWQDARFKMWKIPVGGGDSWLDKQRHTLFGNLAWGKNPKKIAYLNFGAFGAPLMERVTPNKAIERWVHHGSGWQVTVSAGADALNTLAHPAMGPATHFAFVAVFGVQPYLTDLFDKEGKPGIQMMPSAPNYQKRGFMGGLVPPAFPHERPTKHPGAGSLIAAQHVRGAITQLSAAAALVGEESEVLGDTEDSGEGGIGFRTASLMTRGVLDLALPGVFSSASDPYASENYLLRQKKALAELSVPQALKVYDAANPQQKQQIYREVRDKVYSAKTKPWQSDSAALAKKYFNFQPPMASLIGAPTPVH